MLDFSRKVVLITGGTKGIGLAAGLAFGRLGAACTLTYKWGTANEEDVLRAFAEVGAPVPRLVQADAVHDGDTAALLEEMHQRHESIDILISNVAVALVVKSFDEYEKRSLLRSIEYSAWPMVAYTRQIKRVFGRYPRYVVGLSSSGPDAFAANYDFVAASKAVLETLCRYMNYRLYSQDVRVNVVRAGLVRTESFRDTIGRDFEEFASRFNMERQFIPAEDVANTILALCSGLMDSVSGQVIRVDRGTSFFDNMMRLYEERDELSL